MIALMRSESVIQDVFSTFDQNQDGFITAEELRHAYSLLGEPLSESESKKMIEIADMDKDGKVSFEDFREFCALF